MKKFIITLGLALFLVFWNNKIYAQSSPPADHGSSTNEAGGGAPVGGGLFILLGLGAAYAGKKLYDHRRSSLEE